MELRTSFEDALSIAEGIARRKNATLHNLSLSLAFKPHWTAYFYVEDQGGSFVHIESSTSFERHLDDYEENWYDREEGDEDDGL